MTSGSSVDVATTKASTTSSNATAPASSNATMLPTSAGGSTSPAPSTSSGDTAPTYRNTYESLVDPDLDRRVEEARKSLKEMLADIKEVQNDVKVAQENHVRRASASEELEKNWDAFKAKFEEVNRAMIGQIAAGLGRDGIPGMGRQEFGRLASIQGRGRRKGKG